MELVKHETCQQYVARRLSEGWMIISRYGCSVVLSPPDGAFLRPVDLRYGIETLRPNAVGDETNHPVQYPGSTYHWDKVDEVTPDGNDTYVACALEQGSYTIDLYNLPASSVGAGTINFIKVYALGRSFAWDAEYGCFIINMKTGDEVFSSTEFTTTLSWVTYSKQWTLNPKTGLLWTWADIAALQIGVSLRDGVYNLYPGSPAPTGCTQVYVEIDYIPIAIPTVTTQAVSAIAGYTATGNGNMTDNGGENCSKRGVCWNTAGNPTVADSKSEEADSFGTGAFTRPMTGLTPGQHYYVKAYAYNSAGYGYGAQVEFTTVEAPTVTTQAVDDILPTTATGNGNMTDNGGENASKRGVCWNTTGNPTEADSKSEETDSFGVGAFTRPMTGLTPGQLYYVRAYAYNSAGYGYGAQVEFTTKTYYATGYIGDVIDCTELVKTYDRLEWTEEIPSPEQAIEIKIRSSPDKSTWTDWEVIYSSPCTSFGTPVQRYLEWVATLATDQGTPKLKDLGFFWTKKVE
ncbi:hypothetical protein ES708_21507 [subsurface metagenome]